MGEAAPPFPPKKRPVTRWLRFGCQGMILKPSNPSHRPKERR